MTLGLKCARCGASSFNVHVTGRVNVVAHSNLLTVVLLCNWTILYFSLSRNYLLTPVQDACVLHQHSASSGGRLLVYWLKMSWVISPGAARLPHCLQASAHSFWYPTMHSNRPLWYHFSSVVMGTVADTIYRVASHTQTKVNNYLHSYNSLLYPTGVTILGPLAMLLLFLYTTPHLLGVAVWPPCIMHVCGYSMHHQCG